MNRIFKPLIDKGYVTVYLDDILIHSKNAAEHEKHLEEVLTLMRTHDLYAKESKCEWNRSQVTFLGHIVGADGIRMDPKKTELIAKWPAPKTQTEMRSFLGLANYFRKFMIGYASVAAPLNELTHKTVGTNIEHLWTDVHQAAFQRIKHLISEDIVLQYPDFDDRFELISDASLLGTGAVLLQKGRPIAFTSKKFTPAERNYTTGEQELLGVITALKEWRCYLEGPQVTLVTDHHPLTYLQTSAPLSRRQARWLEFMQRFHVTWEYRPGRLNVADPLSRNPTLLYARHIRLLAMVTRSQEARPFRQRIAAAYAQDAWFSNPLNLKGLRLSSDGLWIKQVPGTAYQRDHEAIVIPNDEPLKLEIIHHQHDAPMAGHQGRDKTIELIQRSYWWPRMHAEIDSYIATCEICQRNKARSGKPAGMLSPLPIPQNPWDSVGMDFIVSLPRTRSGHDSILVFIDRLTKMVHLVPCTTKTTAQETAKLFIQNVVRLHGSPLETISDRGPQFASNFWQAFTSMVKVKSRLSSAYHPQTDGQTERANRVVSDTMRNYCDYAQANWNEHLPLVEFSINNSKSSSTKMSPFYMNYGYHPRTPATIQTDSDAPAARQTAEQLSSRLARAKTCLQAAQERSKALYDRKHVNQVFQPGQFVFLSTQNLRAKQPKKTLPRFIGPYRVISKIGEQAYKLELPDEFRIHNVFHTGLLKPYLAAGPNQPPQPISWIEGEPQFAVERILDHEKVKIGNRKATYKYLVRWKHSSPENDSWEHASQFTDDSVIKAYWSGTH